MDRYDPLKHVWAATVGLFLFVLALNVGLYLGGSSKVMLTTVPEAFLFSVWLLLFMYVGGSLEVLIYGDDW